MTASAMHQLCIRHVRRHVLEPGHSFKIEIWSPKGGPSCFPSCLCRSEVILSQTAPTATRGMRNDGASRQHDSTAQALAK